MRFKFFSLFTTMRTLIFASSCSTHEIYVLIRLSPRIDIMGWVLLLLIYGTEHPSATGLGQQLTNQILCKPKFC